jgi:uncharacterized membrane protein YeiH
MTITEFQFPLILEIFATITWAVSGAIVARARGFDFMGVLIISIVASTGGGMLRDGLFLQRTPVMITTPMYIIIPVGAMVVISLFGGVWEHLPWWDKLVNVIDAFGTPAFALLGFQLSLLAGIPFVGAVFIGLLNGVSGGVLRDILVGTVPQIFRPGQLYGVIVISITFLYAGLLSMGIMNSDAAAWIAILVAFTLRLLVIKFKWQTQPVREVRMERKLAQLYRTVTKDQNESPAETQTPPQE